MQVAVQIFGAEETVYDLMRFEERLLDMRPAWLMIAENERAAAEDRFDREGPGWAPLADSTLASKPPGKKILELTGALRDSLTGGTPPIITDDTLIMGTNDPKANFHQKGTSRMPARPVVHTTAADVQEHVRTLQAYMIGGERSAGAWALIP